MITIVNTALIFLFPALGELYNEYGGVVNLGLEGMMLMSALFSIVFGGMTGNPWIGLLGGILTAELLAAIHAFLSVSLGVDQSLSGLAIWIVGASLTTYVGRYYRGPSPVVIHPILGEFSPFLLLAVGLTFVFWFVLFKTRYGLSVRAVGEDPRVADISGIKVARRRYACVLVGGLMAGLGGGYLSLVYSPIWASGMVAGRGWIALALVYFSMGSIPLLVVGTVLFGTLWIAAYGFQMTLQLPVSLLQMIPYVVTIIVLFVSCSRPAWFRGLLRTRLPAGLGRPYFREE